MKSGDLPEFETADVRSWYRRQRGISDIDRDLRFQPFLTSFRKIVAKARGSKFRAQWFSDEFWSLRRKGFAPVQRSFEHIRRLFRGDINHLRRITRMKANLGIKSYSGVKRSRLFADVERGMDIGQLAPAIVTERFISLGQEWTRRVRPRSA